MTPLEDDADMLATILRHTKAAFAWLLPFFGIAIPALLGAVVGVLRMDRRKRGKRKVIASILMAAACGCGLTPLFAHMGGMPDSVASSLAFFLGVWGLEGVDVLQHALRSKSGHRRSRYDDDWSDREHRSGGDE